MSNQTPVIHRYYPRLSSVVTQDDIPDILGFLKPGITNLLDKIYYKDLQYSKGPKGDSAFYSLSVVSKRIDIEIPGTGISLVLNGTDDSAISAFPITVEYQWKILAYLRYFSLGNFSFEPQQIFEVALRVLNVTEEQAIAHFVNTFVTPANQNTTPLMQFATDINAAHGLGLVVNEATTITKIVEDIYQNSNQKYASLVAFATYLASDNLQDTAEKVKTFFKALMPQDIDEFIKEVAIPKFKATLMLSAAIEFPRSILKPVYPLNHPTTPLEVIPEDGNGDPKVSISFGEALFYADTEKGFGYNMDLVLNMSYPAQIGNTGFVIDIHNLKIDLSKTENITEADADGRPKEFMGVYMEYTEIFLPKKWFKKKNPEGNTQQTIGISANHMLIGTGGLSGNIAIRPTYAVKTVGTETKVVDYFSKFFTLDYTSLKVKSLSSSNETAIHNMDELMTFMNGLASPSELKFVYPMGLTTVAGDYREFQKEEDYYKFLASLSVDSLDDDNRTLWFNLGKDTEKSWELGFSKFDIDFHQGQVVHSSLHAGLKIKKFKDYNGLDMVIDVVGEWESKENFKLSAAILPFGLRMNLFNILNFYLQRIEIGKKNDNFYVEADTKITFPQGSFGEKLLGKEGIDLPAIRYYANGKFEIAGGSSIIPINIHLNLGPVRMAVTAIHMGTIQRMFDGKMRTYNYIGFDGGININPLGLDVRGNGVKFYYTADNDEMVKEHGGTEAEYKDSYFHISTLEVDLVIPGSASASAAVAIIKGALTIPEPGVSTEYRGKVSLQLPKMNISGSAEMAFDPKYPGFLVDASVELPFVIPLGSFGIFGFRGLIGYRYVAHKKAIGMTENDTWYDYYVHPQRGINTDKFIGPQFTQEYSAPFSFGAGASLATLDGRLASLRAMVLLSVPSMFAIDAGLTIISERLGLTEDDPKVPPFYAFVIVGDNSLEIGAGGNFQLNKNNGSFIDIKAEVQMGFFFKNQRPWYVNFGTRDKPIRASLFKDSVNIKAESYLMIAAKGIEAGARVDFNLNLIIVKVYAAIEVGAHVSFERPQVGGYIYVEGGAEINLFIVSVALFISIYFRVELILPFLILAEFKFELKIKLAIFKIKLKVHLSIKWEKNDQVDTSAVPPLTYESDPPEIDYPKEERLNNAVKGVNMLTNETFDLPVVQINKVPLLSIKDNPELPVIPLDTYIDIKIEKGLIPTPVAGEKIGGHTSGATEFTDLIPPQKTQPGGHVLRQVKHQYSIEDVEIKILNKEGTAWNKYNPYRAVLTENEANGIPNIDKFKLGFWQKTNDKYDTIRILASTPFSFLDSAQPGWFIPEQYGITASSLFCTKTEDVWNESNVLDKTVGTAYYQPTGSPYNLINGAYYNLLGTVSDTTDYMMVSNASNPHNFAKSLKITNGNTMVILLSEASAKVKLLLSTMASSVRIRYYKDVFSNAIYQSYALIEEVTKTKAELGTELIYEAANFAGQYVSKIEIIPYNINQQEIDDINAQIDQIWANATANTTGEVISIVLSPAEQAEYDKLVTKLKALKAGGCTTSQCNELDFNVMHVENGYNGMLGNGFVNFDMSNVAVKWIDYETQYMMITGGNTPPYVDFNTHSVIFLYLPESPLAPFIKHNSVITKITDKVDGIDICYSSDYPKETINKAVIIKVNKTNEKPLNLKFTPDCGCNSETEPCNKDTRLCNFLTELMYNLNQCIVYQGVDGVTQLRISMKCFITFMNTIYSFDKEFPEYNLVQGIGYVKELLEKLKSYLNTEGSTIFGALQLTKEIHDVIFNLGNCGCNDDGSNNGNTVVNCYTLFHHVKWMTAEEYEYQQTIPSQAAVQADMQLMQEAMSKVVQPVWRPNSVYYINLKLKDNVNGDTPHIIDYYFAFKTVGPIGHYEKKNEHYIENLKDENGDPILNKKKNADEYPITSLKSYIDLKKSYPNADGDLLLAKPLFYGNEQCKIEFFFTKPYIYNMLKEWSAHPGMGVNDIKGSINIAIKDPITKTIIPYPLPIDWQTQETVPGAAPSWTSDTDPNLPLGIQQMINYVNHVNHGNTGMACSITLGEAVKPKSYTYSVELTDLQPEKLYTAMVFNAFDDDGDNAFDPQITSVPGEPDKVYEENQKIHEFVFKTSRYKDFKEQVESYKLKDYDDKGIVIGQKDAIYEVKADLKQQQLDDLYTLVSGGIENPYLKGLANTYSELFDRAFEGVMGLKPLNPPTNTEFVKIINANNDVVALLIRNPEPFNDPKIPLADIQECFKVLNAAGINNTDYKAIYAKDYSQILVMHKSKKITEPKLKLAFMYKSWNGTAYTQQGSTVTINELQINN